MQRADHTPLWGFSFRASACGAAKWRDLEAEASGDGVASVRIYSKSDSQEMNMTFQFPVLGIQEIDEQHRHLIDCLERLESWVGKGHGFAAALDAFATLNDYVALHFSNEEAIFRAAGYPKLEEHIAEHQKLRDELARLYQQVLDGGDVTEDLVALVRDWMVTHIGIEDMEFATFSGTRQAADA
jgi:hemerythrin-like metal-binding protein